MIPSQKSAITENEVMMYLAIGFKHLRLIVLLMVFSLLLGLGYYDFTKPVYYAKTLVDMEVLDRPVTDNNVFMDSTEKKVRMELESPMIRERTAKKLGINVTGKELQRNYIKKVSVSFDSAKNLVIEVWPYSYELSRDWGETMVQEYLLAREERRLQRLDLMNRTFSKEMAEMKERMETVFNSKHDFRDTNELTKIIIELNNLSDVPRRLAIVKQQLGMMEETRHTLDSQSLDTIRKLSLLSSLDKELQSNLELGQTIPRSESAQPIIVVPSMVSNPENRAWETLEKQRRLLQEDYDRLGYTYLPGHPRMRQIKAQLDEVDGKLDAELKFAVDRFEVNLANLVNKRNELEKKLPEFQEVSRRHEKYLEEYKHFNDGQLAWQQMHAQLEKRLNLLDFGNDKERVTLRYLGFAEELKPFPISPHRFKLILYSLLLGIALSIAIPFLLEYLDSRVSDVEQVEETLRIRGLGVVPKISDPETSGLYLVGDKRPDYHLQENFRVIRTNLVVNAETGTLPHVILVTSAMPQEGKTVVSSNLAMSFAMKGEKVLLIDGDLRRGRIHHLFAAHNKPGLSDVLRDQRPVDEAFRPTPHPNLTLMTCGKHLNSASEILDSPSFTRLIEQLRQQFDRIIIDTPPVLGLAETSIIQRNADGILFVIWNDFTPIRNVKAAIHSLQTNGAKFCGFVLNRLDFDTLGNRYKYFYYAPNYYTNYKAIEAPATSSES